MEITDPARLHTSFGRVLGSGAFGQVYRGTLDGKSVAVKETANSKGIVEELTALSKVPPHKHVVRFLGYMRLAPHERVFETAAGERKKVDFDKGSVLIVQELLDGGDLFAAIRARPAPSYDELKRYAAELAEGLAHMHAAGFVHGDLKLPNAMLHGGVVKLVDFGLAKAIGDDFVGLCGTLDHMAPELFGKGGRTPATDVWALGVTLYALFSERSPYHEDKARIDHTKGSKRYTLDSKHIAKAREALSSGLRPDIDADLRAKGHYNADLVRAIARCWESDPKRRPSAKEVTDALRAVGAAAPATRVTHVTAGGGGAYGGAYGGGGAGGGWTPPVSVAPPVWSPPPIEVNPYSGPMPWSDSARGIVRDPVTRALISVGGRPVPSYPHGFGGTIIMPRY
jgi:serine/threonine protein kinase